MSLRRTPLVLLFGVVLIYVPIRLFAGLAPPPAIGALQLTGLALGTGGATLAVWCVGCFAVVGRGTPVPFAPPIWLVTRGPYAVIRNPMYVSVALLCAGAACYFASPALAGYTVFFALASHGFVVWYEEPTLQQTFGAEYAAYRRRVGRWRPRA